MPVSLIRLTGLVGVLVLLAACGRDPEPAPTSDMLGLIPADTPYAFVTSRRMPEELRAPLGNHYAAQLAAQRASLVEMQRQIEASGQADAIGDEVRHLFRVLDAAFAEFEGRDTAAGLRELGIDPVTRSALYGLGLLPVLRVEIADAQLLNATLDRIEQRAGVAAARGRLGDQEYRRISLGDADLVLAVTADELVAGILAHSLFDRDLPILLGQARPERSLADSGDLGAIMQRHGFSGYGEGFVRLDELAEVLLGGGSARNAEAVRALGAGGQRPSAACAQLARGVVAGMPRMVMGVTAADRERIAVRGIWESTPGVASYLRKLAAPVPGVGVPATGLMRVGMGIELPQLRNAIEALLREVSSQGAGCDWVDPALVQAVMPQLNLVLGPMTAGIKGFNLEVDDLRIDPDTLSPTALSAGLLAAVDDPRGVFALGAMVNPEFASVELPQDGSFVTLPLDSALGDGLPTVRAAAQDRALLLVAGESTDAVAARLGAADSITPPPLLAVDYGVKQFVERFATTIDLLTQQLRDQAQADTAFELQQQMDSFRLQAQLFDRLRMLVYATEAGLVVDQEMVLR